MGFKPCPSEPCIYKRSSKGITNLIAVYVDDLIIASSSKSELIQIKADIASKFEVVDGGQLTYFLGMEIEREGETGSITLCQKQYILRPLKDYNMEDCRDVATTLDAGFKVHCSNEAYRKVDKLRTNQ